MTSALLALSLDFRALLPEIAGAFVRSAGRKHLKQALLLTWISNVHTKPHSNLFDWKT